MNKYKCDINDKIKKKMIVQNISGANSGRLNWIFIGMLI